MYIQYQLNPQRCSCSKHIPPKYIPVSICSPLPRNHLRNLLEKRYARQTSSGVPSVMHRKVAYTRTSNLQAEKTRTEISQDSNMFMLFGRSLSCTFLSRSINFLIWSETFNGRTCVHTRLVLWNRTHHRRKGYDVGFTATLPSKLLLPRCL